MSGGHLVQTREVDGTPQFVCVACWSVAAEDPDEPGRHRFRSPCPFVGDGVPVPQPDAAGRTWHTAAAHLGGHVRLTVRHGVEGQRALLGTLTVDADVWPQLRVALAGLGQVQEG